MRDTLIATCDPAGRHRSEIETGAWRSRPRYEFYRIPARNATLPLPPADTVPARPRPTPDPPRLEVARLYERYDPTCLDDTQHELRERLDLKLATVRRADHARRHVQLDAVSVLDARV